MYLASVFMKSERLASVRHPESKVWRIDMGVASCPFSQRVIILLPLLNELELALCEVSSWGLAIIPKVKSETFTEMDLG